MSSSWNTYTPCPPIDYTLEHFLTKIDRWRALIRPSKAYKSPRSTPNSITVSCPTSCAVKMASASVLLSLFSVALVSGIIVTPNDFEIIEEIEIIHVIDFDLQSVIFPPVSDNPVPETSTTAPGAGLEWPPVSDIPISPENPQNTTPRPGFPPVSDNPLKPEEEPSQTVRPGFPPVSDSPLSPDNNTEAPPPTEVTTTRPGFPPVSDNPLNPDCPEIPSEATTNRPGFPPVSDSPNDGSTGGDNNNGQTTRVPEIQWPPVSDSPPVTNPWGRFLKFFHV